MSLKDDLTKLRDDGIAQINQATDVNEITKEIKVNLLGKKGPITQALRGIKDLPVEKRPEVGSYANEIRDEIQNALDEKLTELENKALEAQLVAEKSMLLFQVLQWLRDIHMLSNPLLMKFVTCSLVWVTKLKVVQK
ncbi:hypothetical protein AKUG0410_07940 [Apilactobacillus kunkeei]|nr:hypothetical protein AKUG0412_07940 [Apilactobacillus kunkeei]CAI2677605.1 hypothetical protein AKUG0410_07940 [Apilactobacillus kunkeei]